MEEKKDSNQAKVASINIVEAESFNTFGPYLLPLTNSFAFDFF